MTVNVNESNAVGMLDATQEEFDYMALKYLTKHKSLLGMLQLCKNEPEASICISAMEPFYFDVHADYFSNTPKEDQIHVFVELNTKDNVVFTYEYVDFNRNGYDIVHMVTTLTLTELINTIFPEVSRFYTKEV